MNPPGASVAGNSASTADQPLADFVCPIVIKKRSDFLKAARARRVVMPGFVLQGRDRKDDAADGEMRIGYTCSKKVGNAVVRNRAKRRLRAIANATLPSLGKRGWDYVLIGRANVTVDRPFADLQDDLQRALNKLHGSAK